jgi:RHS repeat-associated protein
MSYPNPPKENSPSVVDGNGVNVAQGTYQVSSTDVSIGPSGAGGLALVRGNFDREGRFQHNYMAGISMLNSLEGPPGYADVTPVRYEVQVNGRSETFSCPGPSTCTSDDGRGGTLDWDPDNNPNTKFAIYRAADGSWGSFDTSLSGGWGYGGTVSLLDWTDAASGVVTHYTYKTTPSNIFCYCGTTYLDLRPGEPMRRLQSVTNNLGYQVKFTYQVNDYSEWFDPISGALTSNEMDWGTVVQVVAINNAVEYCDPAADSCNVSASWPRATYTYVKNTDTIPAWYWSVTATVGAQDATISRTTTYHLTGGTMWRYQPISVQLPGSSTPDITIALDGHDRVQTITRHGDGSDRTWTYSYGDSFDPNATNYVSVCQTGGFCPVPPPSSPPPEGYSGAFQRTTSVSDPLGHATTYSSSVSFRTQCNGGQYQLDVPPTYITIFYSSCFPYYLDAHVVSVQDPLGRTTSYLYDSYKRVTRVTPPEGTPTSGYTQYTYDSGDINARRGNVTEVRRVSKTPNTPADIVTSVVYPPASACTSDPIRCNKPTSITDPRVHETDFTYDPTTGGVATATSPAPTGAGPTGTGVRPETRYTYTAYNARYLTSAGVYANGWPSVYRLTRTSTCAAGSAPACVGTTDETVTINDYQLSSSPNNVLPAATTIRSGCAPNCGDGAFDVIAKTSFTYDNIGNLTAVDGPLDGTADTTLTYYDGAREVIGVVGPDPDGTGPLLYRAARTRYDAKGHPTTVEQGTTTSQNSDYNTAFASFVPHTMKEARYNGFGLASDALIWDLGANLQSPTDDTILALTETSYDAALRPLCSAVRMNPDQFVALAGQPANDACALGSQGSNGPDRITETVYDAAGQVTAVKSAYGTSLQQVTKSTGYTLNGLEDWVEDSRADDGQHPHGNRTDYSYDGFDRLIRIDYPGDPVDSGNVNTSDNEQFTYDPAGNHLTEQRRFTSPETAPVFSLAYDNLNRLVVRDAPGTQPDETRAYDNLGHQTCAQTWDPGTAPPVTTLPPLVCAGGSPKLTLQAGFDALGRQHWEAQPLGSVVSWWDAAGRRTNVTWPDLYSVSYWYNTAGDLAWISDSTGSNLAAMGYDDLGRRTWIVREPALSDPNWYGATTWFGYDAASRLSSFRHDLGGTGTTYDIAVWLARNPAGQLTNLSRDNAVYAWTPSASATTNYTANGLNQYTAVGGATVANDARGNMTSDGAQTYAYDFDNRLTSASGGATLTYDPGSRLFEVASGSGTRGFLYDGPRVIAEYAINPTTGAATLARRYVHGAGVDEPLVWFEGTGTSDAHWLIPDERGSIQAVMLGNGSVSVNRYDEYGAPATGNTGLFQYTGQMWLPELQLYHYKARVYHPRFGRFLQTDPKRYDAGMDLYAYVGDDPLDRVDPTGEESCPAGKTCPDIPSAPQSVVDAAIKAGHQMPINEGSKEFGAHSPGQVMVDKNDPSKVTEVRTSSKAAMPDPTNPMTATMKPIEDTDPYALGADVHPHPRQGDQNSRDMSEAAESKRVNTRNLYPSRGDYQHMNQTNAPMFVRNTAGAMTETYRVDGVDHTIVVEPGSAPLGPVPNDVTNVVDVP